MTDHRAPTTKTGPALPELSRSGLRETRASAIPLIEYLALRKIPWSLAYVGFVCYVVDITTYVVKSGIALMTVALFGMLLGSRRTHWPFPVLLFLMFLIWAALATAVSEYPGDFQPLIELGKIFLVFLVAVNVLWNRLALRLFLLIFLACFTFFPVRGTLANYYIFDYADFGRPAWVWLFGNPNDLAALTILALALAVGFLHKETPRILRLAALFMCLVFPFIILLTQSRGAFIATCVFVLLCVLRIGQNRIRAILALTIIATIVVAAAPSAVWERVGGLQNATSTEAIAVMDKDNSAGERLALVQTAFQIIADHPLVGVGRGRGVIAQGIYNPKRGNKSFHNTYLEVLAETGAPGFILFLWLIFFLLARARSARRQAVDLRETAEWQRLQLIEFGLYGYLVAGIWGTYAYLSLLYVYLAILFAQTEALNSLAQEVLTGTITSNSPKTTG